MFLLFAVPPPTIAAEIGFGAEGMGIVACISVVGGVVVWGWNGGGGCVGGVGSCVGGCTGCCMGSVCGTGGIGLPVVGGVGSLWVDGGVGGATGVLITLLYISFNFGSRLFVVFGSISILIVRKSMLFCQGERVNMLY